MHEMDSVSTSRCTRAIVVLVHQHEPVPRQRRPSPGVHSDVRTWRKAVTKEVVTLQDKVDALLNGREIAEVEPDMPDLPLQSVKEDTEDVRGE